MGAATWAPGPGVCQYQGGASLAPATARHRRGFGGRVDHAGYPLAASPCPARGCLGHLPAAHQHRPGGSHPGCAATSPTSTYSVRAAGPHRRWSCLCGPDPASSPWPSSSHAGSRGCRRSGSCSARFSSSSTAVGEWRSAGHAVRRHIWSERLAAAV